MTNIGPAILVIAATACGWAHVGGGEVGVRWTRDGIQQQVYGPGVMHE